MIRKAMSKLINWKNLNTKKPVLVFGARHVGKTFLLKQFGSEQFRDVIYVNCESNIFSSDIFNENSPFERIVNNLSLIFNKPIDKNESLIIFDEIEKNQSILKALISDQNENLEYYVTATLSMNSEFALEEYNIPSNRIEMVNLYPMTFDEFLQNTNNEDLAEKIRECYKNNESLPGLLHKKAFDLYYDYLLVGGMPEAVNEYINTNSIINVIDNQKNIIESYKTIMPIPNDQIQPKKLAATYTSIPAQLFKENKKFKYKLVETGGTSNLLGNSIDYLVNTCLAYKSTKIEDLGGDVVSFDPSSFILYLNDVGLLTNMSEFPLYFIRNREAVNEKMYDMLSENYVACALRSNSVDLYYWKNNYDSSLDFIIRAKSGSLIPVEVKSNNSIKSRSLNNFMNEYRPQYGIRFSTKNFSFKNNIKYIPLYAAFCVTKNNV